MNQQVHPVFRRATAQQTHQHPLCIAHQHITEAKLTMEPERKLKLILVSLNVLVAKPRLNHTNMNRTAILPINLC
jgi:hypothetical protein